MQNYEYLVEVEKFNPYHDSRGRFTTPDGATQFTYAPGKSKAHDMAIARAKERHQQAQEEERIAREAERARMAEKDKQRQENVGIATERAIDSAKKWDSLSSVEKELEKDAVATAKTKRGEYEIYAKGTDENQGKMVRRTVEGYVDEEHNIGYQKVGEGKGSHWESTDLGSGLIINRDAKSKKECQTKTADVWEGVNHARARNKYADAVETFKTATQEARPEKPASKPKTKVTNTITKPWNDMTSAERAEAIATAKTKKGQFDIYVNNLNEVRGQRGRRTVSGRIDAESGIGYAKNGSYWWNATDLATGLAFGAGGSTLKEAQRSASMTWDAMDKIRSDEKYAGYVERFNNATHENK